MLEAKLRPKWDVCETGFIMRKFLPKMGFLFEKLDFRQLRSRRVLGGALLSTEHVIRMVKEFQDCVACVLVFLFAYWVLFILLVDVLDF